VTEAGAVTYVDVWSRADIPGSPDPSRRYLDFLGGTKELRCFLVPAELPRAQFMQRHPDLLDAALAPIYEHHGICVRQDASYALPGFYIVSLTRHFRSFDEFDGVTNQRFFLIARDVRRGMRKLGVENANIYCEEKPDPSCNVHLWLLPVHGDGSKNSTAITRLNVKDYLSRFRLSDQRDTILDYNSRMRDYLRETELVRRDDELSRALDSTLR
jgi:diadenosine tetraphosphate (Ap4A) HIT family hydrolase